MGRHRAFLAADGLLQAHHARSQRPELDKQQQGGDDQVHDGP
jgi:hypothetical protein